MHDNERIPTVNIRLDIPELRLQVQQCLMLHVQRHEAEIVEYVRQTLAGIDIDELIRRELDIALKETVKSIVVSAVTPSYEFKQKLRHQLAEKLTQALREE